MMHGHNQILLYLNNAFVVTIIEWQMCKYVLSTFVCKYTHTHKEKHES